MSLPFLRGVLLACGQKKKQSHKIIIRKKITARHCVGGFTVKPFWFSSCGKLALSANRLGLFTRMEITQHPWLNKRFTCSLLVFFGWGVVKDKTIYQHKKKQLLLFRSGDVFLISNCEVEWVTGSACLFSSHVIFVCRWYVFFFKSQSTGQNIQSSVSALSDVISEK